MGILRVALAEAGSNGARPEKEDVGPCFPLHILPLVQAAEAHPSGGRGSVEHLLHFVLHIGTYRCRKNWMVLPRIHPMRLQPIAKAFDHPDYILNGNMTASGRSPTFSRASAS
jgi:hypothetical protein